MSDQRSRGSLSERVIEDRRALRRTAPAHPGWQVAARCDELALKLYRALTEGEGEFVRRLLAVNQ